jgi:multiple sugar transport system permease protein
VSTTRPAREVVLNGARRLRRAEMGKRARGFLLYLVLSLLVVVFVAPFLWMILASLKSTAQIFAFPPRIIPNPVIWKNYARAWSVIPLARFYLNSILVAGSVAFAQVVTSAMAAYVFARLYFPAKNLLFVIYLGVMMIPTQVTVIPLFIIVRRLGLIDTYGALILPFLAYPFGAFLLRQFFLTIPREIEDAAIADGCPRLRILAQIIVPLSRSALVTLGMLAFMFTWNSFFWPLLVTNTADHFTIQVGLAMLRTQLVSAGGVDWSLLMAVTVISILPVLIFYVFAQKQIIRGITLTGLKM